MHTRSGLNIVYVVIAFNALTLIVECHRTQPVKMSAEILMWLSVWNEEQMIYIWSSWCHCHLFSASGSFNDFGTKYNAKIIKPTWGGDEVAVASAGPYTNHNFFGINLCVFIYLCMFHASFITEWVNCMMDSVPRLTRKRGLLISDFLSIM